MWSVSGAPCTLLFRTGRSSMTTETRPDSMVLLSVSRSCAPSPRGLALEQLHQQQRSRRAGQQRTLGQPQPQPQPQRIDRLDADLLCVFSRRPTLFGTDALRLFEAQAHDKCSFPGGVVHGALPCKTACPGGGRRRSASSRPHASLSLRGSETCVSSEILGPKWRFSGV